MAQVYLPELSSEDHLPSVPRAPPPSPEMQPRNHSHVFEIPASKFEGIGLDLRRDTFPLDEEDESPLGPSHHRHRFHAPGVSGFTRELDENDDDDELSFPHSPQKRVCCSPGTLPVDLTTTAFPSSNHSSLVSSGFGSLGLHGTVIPEEGGVGVADVGGASHASTVVLGFPNHQHPRRNGPHSSSPTYFGSRTNPEDSLIPGQLTTTPNPHGIPGVGGASTLMATPNLQPGTTQLSRSYDTLHSLHPHLPHSFETTQLPEPRPHRSRTLDATPAYSPPHETRRVRAHTLDASYGGEEQPVERKRKVSIKRKIADDMDEDDPNLQFSFEYSYSSTGSGGESEWVMVDCKAEPTRPMEKKACCLGDSLAMTVPVCHHEMEGVALLGEVNSAAQLCRSGSGGMVGREEGLSAPLIQQNPLGLGVALPGAVGMSPFALPSTPSQFGLQQEGEGVVGGRVATPTDQPVSMESMECEVKVEALDQMECEQLLTNDVGGATLYQPVLTVEQSKFGDVMMRSNHRTGAVPLPLRRSCVEEGVASLDPDLESRLNLSKSL